MLTTEYPHGQDFPILRVSTELCEAEVSLYGGHLLSWTPRGQHPVIFMSPRAVFRQGKALRGGIPLCWPWFGKHPSDASQPSHGVARISLWNLVSQEELEGGALRLVLELPPAQELLPRAVLVLELGSVLRVNLLTVDVPQAMPFSAALHTYFAVSDYEKVAVTGLEESEFTEFAAAAQPHSEDPLIPIGAIDRIYHPVPAEQEISIHDPAWQRSLRITRAGSGSCVVWNPGAEQAAGMADLGAEAARGFLAVETTAVPAEGLALRCGESHELAMCVEVIPVV